MKIRYYIDIWPGSNLSQYVPMANANPGEKTFGTKRFAFDVTIPDHLIYDVDHVSPEVGKVDIIADEGEQTP